MAVLFILVCHMDLCHNPSALMSAIDDAIIMFMHVNVNSDSEVVAVGSYIRK